MITTNSKDNAGDARSSQRRDFLRRIGGFGAAVVSSVRPAAAKPERLPNPVGYATIAWPVDQFEQALRIVSGLKFKGMQMTGLVERNYQDKAPALRTELESLHLKPVALSCWGVNLDPANNEDNSRQFREYVDFQGKLGGRYLQVTDGGKPGAAYSDDQIKSLGTRMNELGRVAADSGLELGYHPHFGTFGETREGMDRVLAATDPRHVGLIADVAHIALGGGDPADVIHTYHDRLVFCHFKDLRKDVAKLSQRNRDLVRHSQYHFTTIGDGVVDFNRIVQVFRDVQFKGWVIVELDGYEPPAGGPAEAAKINKEALEQMGFEI